jgi:hypothetical protein
MALTSPVWLGLFVLAAAAQTAGRPITVTSLAKLNAPSGALAGSLQRALTDEASWPALWGQLTANISPAPAIPKVDYTKDVVIFAAMGDKHSGGFKVEITGAAEQSGKVVVEVTETSPGQKCMNAMMMTSPVVLATIPKQQAEVTFHVVKKIVDCQ